MKKIGIINLTVNNSLYNYFDDIKRLYYKKYGIPYRFIYNEPNYRKVNSDEMLYISDVVHPSGVPVMLEKFIWACMNLLSDPLWSKCDYIVRTNSSTFVNLELFLDVLGKMPKKRCYAGKIVFGKFVSGTCIVFSVDVIRYLIRLRLGKECFGNDDVVLAKYMRKKFIRMRNIDMYYYDDNADVDRRCVQAVLDKYPLIRVRNDDDRNKYDKKIWSYIASCVNVYEDMSIDERTYFCPIENYRGA